MNTNEVMNVISNNKIHRQYKTIVRVSVPKDTDPLDAEEIYDMYVRDSKVKFIVLSPDCQSICIHVKRS